MLDDYLDVERLREILATKTGKGVSVGILDTGVESSHPDLGDSVKKTFEISSVDNEISTNETEAGTDLAGHGTACAGIIHSIAPDADLYSMRVIGAGHGDTADKLIEGFRFALEQDWPILNLSLGTGKFNREVWKLAEKAHYQGKIVIAAKDNQRGKIGFPAALSSVIAVEMDHFEDPLKFQYQFGIETEIAAKGIYIEAPCPGGGRQLYTGTSFACPHISAIAARFVEEIGDLNSFQFRTILTALSAT